MEKQEIEDCRLSAILFGGLANRLQSKHLQPIKPETRNYKPETKVFILKFSTDQIILSLVIGAVILCVTLCRLFLI